MDMPFTLYASPIPRAMETAKVVSRRLGRCVTHLNALQEAVAGNLAGLTDDKMQQRYPNFMERWNSNVAFPSNESLQTLDRRTTTGLMAAIAQSPKMVLLCVVKLRFHKVYSNDPTLFGYVPAVQQRRYFAQLTIVELMVGVVIIS